MHGTRAAVEQTPAERGAQPWRIAVAGGDTATPRNLRRRVERLAAWLGPLAGLRVLDAGCGGGAWVRALLAQGTDAWGIEAGDAKLAAARGLPPEVARRIQAGDLERMPFADARFDAVLSNEVIEHVPDDARALREMVRVLRPGGRLVLFAPNRLHPFETHGVYLRGSGRRVSHATPFVPWLPLALGRRVFRYWARNYWPWELRAALRGAGLCIERAGTVWPTFENISGRQPGWMLPLRPLLRAASAGLERTPGLRAFGASQWIVARRPEEPARGSTRS